ncbi:hypothetical protein AB0P05_10945 [Streptomyces flaveolus]|uniref:hypothetical protein n=1 Tax=Streptomyces flaveolus TaxID=67297 RepID=UPI003428484F
MDVGPGRDRPRHPRPRLGGRPYLGLRAEPWQRADGVSDGGRSWETNWTMDVRRTGESCV